MRYWQFFPARRDPDDWGRIPVWGFAEVLASAHGVPHRTPLAGMYNRYARADDDPLHDVKHEDHRMLLWPPFFTAFLIDDFLDDNCFFGAEAVVVSSASSKTAIGAAFQSRRRAVEVIGLTSPANVGFVTGLGIYDRVVTYDDVASLAASGLGPAGFDDRIGPAWRAYLDFCDGWMHVEHGSGPEAVERVDRELLEGRTDPATGHALSL